MTIQPHDFSRPPSLHPDTRAKLAQWLTRANSALSEAMAGFGLHAEIRLDECSTAWPVPSLREWSEKAAAYRVKLAELSPLSIIALPNPLAQMMIAALMGEQLAEWPEERDFSPSEASVGEYLLSKILTSLIDSWISDDQLQLTAVEPEPNLRRTKVFKVKEPFIVCRSTVTTPIGGAAWCWMMPHGFLVELFGSVRGKESVSGMSARQQLEALARGMTTQVTIRLGGVQLSAPEVAGLRVGDLVVLNQKTTDPLRAMVSDRPRYLGWPGRVGNRQAFEIAAEGPRRHRSSSVESISETETAVLR